VASDAKQMPYNDRGRAMAIFRRKFRLTACATTGG
jgi:hypothetical protein